MKNNKVIIGVDEVGRGCLAGPVVSAAVMLKDGIDLKSIKNYWSDENQKKLKLQAEVINMTYSWDVRSVEWKNFFDEASR